MLKRWHPKTNKRLPIYIWIYHVKRVVQKVWKILSEEKEFSQNKLNNNSETLKVIKYFCLQNNQMSHK